MSAVGEMLVLTLPDGKTREVAPGTLGREVVASIGPGLLKAAIAIAIDGEVQDLMTPIRRGGAFVVITEKDPRALAVLRHSGAHILATAVRRLRPEAKIGFGPAIDDGFYYDFEVSKPFTPEDLAAFEAEMHKVIAEKYAFVRAEVSQEEARKVFADDPLKLERLDDFTDPSEIISTYTDGPFTDLCRGPHVPDTSYLKHFKLLSAAGAYWRGDERRQMLQRIYATAFFKKDELETHLHNLEEAKKRDHRALGRQLDLFQFFPQAPGAAFWTPRGTAVWNALEQFVRERQREDFLEIKTPLLYTKKLWEQSGHWGKYRENMFLVHDKEAAEAGASAEDALSMSLKPMNCPSHHLYFAASKHSYRDLPMRYVTFDVLHRNELSGALSGLTRVRQFSQDDCHVYLREDQIASEVQFLLDFILGHYETFGLTATLKFATRPEQRIGSDELWDRAESALKAALEASGRPYQLKEGDGAFYGPKIDFDVTDSIGRAWQLGTIQLDYNAPERFDLAYTGEDNAAHRPVVIHRAVCGSFERFLAILIEHFAGAFPLWLAPEQVRVLPISDEVAGYAEEVTAKLKAAGIRAVCDTRSDTLNYRIRDGELMKVPYMAVCGKREAEAGQVAIRVRGAGKKQEIVSVADFEARLLDEIRTRALTPIGAGEA
ncbi:MAG TPA: threonine--tRNA ligase [Gemmatimonadaceae bacterium]|nr:threonine--tRNA ligase [Gemmatimonadaceae bacterium]HRQ78456.1 threonine--tRNA ligase [Gemmatimonadaceae bacterium]